MTAATGAERGLLREGETARQAIARLERTKEYADVVASDEGQRLLEAAAGEAKAARAALARLSVPTVEADDLTGAATPRNHRRRG
jgi:hypothetical protein